MNIHKLFRLNETEMRILYLRCRAVVIAREVREEISEDLDIDTKFIKNDLKMELIASYVPISISKFYKYQATAFEKLRIKGKPKQKFDNFIKEGGLDLINSIDPKVLINWDSMKEEYMKKSVLLKTE